MWEPAIVNTQAFLFSCSKYSKAYSKIVNLSNWWFLRTSMLIMEGKGYAFQPRLACAFTDLVNKQQTGIKNLWVIRYFWYQNLKMVKSELGPSVSRSTLELNVCSILFRGLSVLLSTESILPTTSMIYRIYSNKRPGRRHFNC